MHIDRNSYGTLAIVYSVSAAVLAAVVLLFPNSVIIWPVLAFVAVFCIWQTAFFRVPVRKRTGSSKVVTSVADGKVVILEKVQENEYIKGECIQVSIYMDFFDVHANFWPVDGTVEYCHYYPGEHFLAFKPKASEENEHSCTGIVTEDGKRVFFKQLAGTFARRIVYYSKPGLKTKSGEQCGIIKFGSRIDMYLPLDADIKVKLGDKTRAVETVIAVL